MSDAVIHINDENFDNKVLQSDIPVLVDFWAPWCGPCQALGPILESIAEKRKGTVKVAKVNVDESAEVARRMGIRSIPSVMLFSHGELREMTIGAQSEHFFDKMLDRALLDA